MEYSLYLSDLKNVLNSSAFKYASEIKIRNENMTIFSYMQQNGKSKENNIFLLQSFVNYTYGTKSFDSKDINQVNLLAGYFDKVGVKYQRFRIEGTIHVSEVADKNGGLLRIQ